jgi:hypothetical protein
VSTMGAPVSVRTSDLTRPFPARPFCGSRRFDKDRWDLASGYGPQRSPHVSSRAERIRAGCRSDLPAQGESLAICGRRRSRDFGDVHIIRRAVRCSWPRTSGAGTRSPAATGAVVQLGVDEAFRRCDLLDRVDVDTLRLQLPRLCLESARGGTPASHATMSATRPALMPEIRPRSETLSPCFCAHSRGPRSVRRTAPMTTTRSSCVRPPARKPDRTDASPRRTRSGGLLAEWCGGAACASGGTLRMRRPRVSSGPRERHGPHGTRPGRRPRTGPARP